jgi:hypothetical protein
MLASQTIPASQISGLEYQTVEVATSPLNQRPIINFSNLFAASDDSINGRTTITLNNNNTSGAATYGSATQVAQVFVDSAGLIIAVSNVTITGVTPGGTPGGDLSASVPYPNPLVATVGGKTAAAIATTVTTVAAATNANTASTIVYRDPSGNFSAGTITASLTGNVTGNASGTAAAITGNLGGAVTSVGMTTTIATVNSNVGTFGDSSTATHAPHMTVNAAGQITAISSVAISGTPPGGSAGGDLGSSYPSPTVVSVGGGATLATAIASSVSATSNATALATDSLLAQRDSKGGCGFTTLEQTIATVSPSATPTFDLSQGTIQQITVSANITAITTTNLGVGQFVVLDFINSTGTPYTVQYPSNFYMTGGASNVVTMGTTSSGHNAQLFYCDGTNLYGLGNFRTS